MIAPSAMRNTPRTVLWLALATAATIAVVLAIKSLRPSEDEAAVKDTVTTFLKAIGHDGEEACLQLSREAQARLMERAHETSCPRAAEHTPRRSSALFDFGAATYDFLLIRFGPEHRWARVPPQAGSEAFFSPIPLEQGDDRWAITNLRWFYEL